MKTKILGLLAMGLLVGPMVASAVVLGPYSGTISGTDSPMTGRLFRDGSASDCSSSKAYPGTFGSSNQYYYDVFSFVNNGSSAECVTVSTAQTLDNFFSAYLGAFDPGNLAANYLGDQGASGITTFSFLVPAFSAFQIVVNSTSSGTGLNYTFEVSGYNIGTSVPEPGALALLGLGLAGLGLARRRKAN